MNWRVTDNLTDTLNHCVLKPLGVSVSAFAASGSAGRRETDISIILEEH